MPILLFFICCIKTLFIQIICGNLITYIQENLGRFQDLLTVSFYMHGTLRSIQNLCHWRSLFGIPIDLIHNTNQKIKANISKRAKFVLAYVYIYMYISSLHIKQWMHILIISMTCSLQRPKHCKITTFKNLPPSLPALYIYPAQEINEFTKFTNKSVPVNMKIYEDIMQSIY